MYSHPTAASCSENSKDSSTEHSPVGAADSLLGTSNGLRIKTSSSQNREKPPACNEGPSANAPARELQRDHLFKLWEASAPLCSLQILHYEDRLLSSSGKRPSTDSLQEPGCWMSCINVDDGDGLSSLVLQLIHYIYEHLVKDSFHFSKDTWRWVLRL